MAVATLVGLVHNAVRSHPLRLIPHLKPVAQPADPADVASSGDSQMMGAEQGGPAEPRREAEAPESGGASFSVVISTARAKMLWDDSQVFFIDARQQDNYRRGHIPRSLNVPYNQFTKYYDYIINTVPSDARIVCYCWSPTCDFSDLVAEELHLIGYENVMIYRDGWEAWEEAGYPTAAE